MRHAADSDALPPADAATVMGRALREEQPPAIPGLREVSAAEIAFQRRAAVVLTAAPAPRPLTAARRDP